MNLLPKTTQIFLPGGDPRGIRVAEITTRIVQLLEVPRSLLPDFLQMPESGQVAVYFLFGQAADGLEPKVYVGQTGNLRARLVRHHQEKELWERALVVISRTNSLTQTHALFLEWHCLQAAQQAGRYADENGNAGSKPHTPAPLEADCLEIYDTGRTLLATLGYPLFDPVVQPPPNRTRSSVARRRARTRTASTPRRGSWCSRVRSAARKTCRPSLAPPGSDSATSRWLRKWCGWRAKRSSSKDALFRSPSMAALAVLGRSANGWIEWRAQTGRTLDAAMRQPPG